MLLAFSEFAESNFGLAEGLVGLHKSKLLSKAVQITIPNSPSRPKESLIDLE